MTPGVGERGREFRFNTARAIPSLIYNVSLLRCPDFRFILPHAGGAMPPLAARMTRMADRDRKVAPKPAQGSMAEMKSLYFDVASSTNPVTLAGLLRLLPAPPGVFGPDLPVLAAIPPTGDPPR